MLLAIWTIAGQEQAAFVTADAVPSPSVCTSGLEKTAVDENDLAVDITVEGQVFHAIFADNETSRDLITQRPLTLNMSDFNGQEKVTTLSNTLTSSLAERPSTIYSGEIYLWSGNQLVLFYRTFPNSYGGYIRLGTIENVSDLVEALGEGDVTMILCMSQ